jgi:hypothetical protein
MDRWKENVNKREWARIKKREGQREEEIPEGISRGPSFVPAETELMAVC